VISPLERTLEDIRAAEAERELTRPQGVPWAAYVARLDNLIDELETLHLEGGIRVPNRMVLRLAAFMERLPAECRHNFALRTRIIYVLDDLFEVQDRLLDLKVPGRAVRDEPAQGSRRA
jgi:hypothetical protein